MPDAYLEGLDTQDSAERWRAAMEAGGGGGQLVAGDAVVTAVVAEEADTVVGFVTYGDLRGKDDEAQAGGEIHALNVRPDAWRRGLGRELLRWGVAALADAGHHAASLWVLVGNERARCFYEHEGWRASKAVRTDGRFGFDMTEVRYDRALQEAASRFT
jgi:GNAT superfamily N-acetyltransferase